MASNEIGCELSQLTMREKELKKQLGALQEKLKQSRESLAQAMIAAAPESSQADHRQIVRETCEQIESIEAALPVVASEISILGARHEKELSRESEARVKALLTEWGAALDECNETIATFYRVELAPRQERIAALEIQIRQVEKAIVPRSSYSALDRPDKLTKSGGRVSILLRALKDFAAGKHFSAIWRGVTD